MQVLDEQTKGNEELSSEARRILLEGSLLAETEAWGEYQFRDLGRAAFPRMAKSLLLRRTPDIYKPETDFVIRGEGHTLFLWEKGWTKSSIVEAFWGIGRNEGKGLVGDIGRIEEVYRISPERFGGSVNEGRILWPKPFYCDVIIIDEWKAFVGSGTKEVDMINIVNPIIERGKGGFDLVKSYISDLDFERQRSELPDGLSKRIRFYPPSRIEYDANATLIAASYNLDRKSLRKLDETGVLSRFDVYTFEVGGLRDRFELIHDITGGGERPTTRREDLRQAYQYTCTLSFRDVRAPDQRWVGDLLREYEDRLSDTSVASNDIKGMVNMRLPGRLIREMIAHAVAKQFARHDDLETELEQVKYDPEDRDYVLGEIPEMIQNDLELQRLMETTSPVPSAETKLLEILAAEGGEMPMGDFKSAARVAFGVKDRQVRNYISKLRNDGRVKTFREGVHWYIMRQSDRNGSGNNKSKIAT